MNYILLQDPSVRHGFDNIKTGANSRPSSFHTVYCYNQLYHHKPVDFKEKGSAEDSIIFFKILAGPAGGGNAPINSFANRS